MDETKPVPRWIAELKVWEVLLWLAVGLVLLGSLLGFLGGWFWLFDLFSHFRWQYVLMLLAVGLVAGVTRRKWLGLAVVPPLAINVVLVLPLWWGGAPQAMEGAADEAGRLRVIQFNVLKHNAQKAAALAWVAEQQADVVVLQEVDDAWIAAAEAGLPGYVKLNNAVARDDNFGMAMFVGSAREVRGAALHWDPARVPRLEAEVLVRGRWVRVLGVHALPPVGAAYAQGRSDQLVALTERIPANSGPVVVVGDLNATPWSAPYIRLIAETGLRNAAAGRGPAGTWPSGFGRWLGIPLDHVLLGPGLVAANHRVGPALSSDHRPVVVDVVVPAPSAAGVDSEE